MAHSALTYNAQTSSVTTIEDSSLTTGARLYVHSSGTDGTTYGTTPDSPLASLDYAVGLATANKNTTIYLMPGHAETLTGASSCVLDIAGITVKGLGNGTNRATFTMSSAAAATMAVQAPNIKLQNIRFVSAIDSLLAFLTITGAGSFDCEDCEFITSSTYEAICFVLIPTTYDNFAFRRCRFYQPTDPTGTDGNASTGCFYFVDSENLFFEDCFFYGNFESAIFHNKTTAAKNVWVRNCYGTQLLSGAEVFIQVANMEGGAVSSLFIVTGSTDVAEANTWGTLSDKFFINLDCGVGNDGLGGQLAVAGASAAS